MHNNDVKIFEDIARLLELEDERLKVAKSSKLADKAKFSLQKASGFKCKRDWKSFGKGKKKGQAPKFGKAN